MIKSSNNNTNNILMITNNYIIIIIIILFNKVIYESESYSNGYIGYSNGYNIWVMYDKHYIINHI